MPKNPSTPSPEELMIAVEEARDGQLGGGSIVTTCEGIDDPEKIHINGWSGYRSPIAGTELALHDKHELAESKRSEQREQRERRATIMHVLQHGNANDLAKLDEAEADPEMDPRDITLIRECRAMLKKATQSFSAQSSHREKRYDELGSGRSGKRGGGDENF